MSGVDGRTGYYLHSAANAQARRAGTTDLLLEALVSSAKAAGCCRMSLMATPWDHRGLARFKSKWSDSQGLSVTYDLPGSTLGRLAVSLLRWQSRGDRRAARSSN